MSKDMTKVALKTRLRAWFYSYRDNEGIIQMDKDAHNQIHKLIEQSEARQPNADEVDELMKDLARMSVYARLPACVMPKEESLSIVKRIKQLLQSRPVVVDSRLIELLNICEKQQKTNLFPHCSRKEYKEKSEILEWKFARIKQLLTQSKAQVTREKIMDVVKRINDEITPGGMTTAEMIKIAYEELGLEVK